MMNNIQDGAPYGFDEMKFTASEEALVCLNCKKKKAKCSGCCRKALEAAKKIQR